MYWDAPRVDHEPLLNNPNGKVPGAWTYVDTAGNITKRGVQSASMTSQSAFFNEKLAFTASYSRDVVEVANLPRLNATITGSTGAPTFQNLLGFNTAGNAYQRKETVSSLAYGAVAYPFQTERQGFIKKFLSPLGFVVNMAENNQPPSS